MQYRDLDLHCVENVYENAEMFTARRKPKIDEIELQTNEEQYDQIESVNRQSHIIKVNEENRGKTIQWKDLPREIKVTIYTLSSMMVVLYCIVIIAAVIISVPKSEDGGWSDWGSWEPCSESCGGGIKSRVRTCTNPRPSISGKGCDGGSEQVVLCNRNSCDVNGTWTLWSAWSNCDVTCDTGTKKRLRLCYNPYVNHSSGALDCEGNSTESVQCQQNPCLDHNVSFLAYGIGNGGPNDAIGFPTILFNSGNGYNSSTGKFTCKTPGIYNFAVTLTKQYQRISMINAYLRLNETNKLYLHAHSTGAYYNNYGSFPLSVTGNFHLNTNDYVYVSGVLSFFINDTRSSFTGVLVNPDD